MGQGVAKTSHDGVTGDGNSGQDDANSLEICRMCFEAGGDLIAPCRCKGTAKWVHRDCLNAWRISSLNPQALTHCCECRFQYVLAESQVVDTRLHAKKWEILQRFVIQILGGCLLLQLAILAIAGMAWLIDYRATLVTFFGFTRSICLFYYVIGFAVLCAVATAGVLITVLIDIGRDLVKAYRNGRFAVELQNIVLSEGFLQMVLGGVGCYFCFSAGSHPKGSSPHKPLLLMIYSSLCVFPGLLTVVLVVGLHIRRGIKEYTRVSRASVVAQAYEVKDLANVEPAVGQHERASQGSTDVQSKIHQDIQNILGPELVPLPDAPSPSTGREALRPQATLNEARQGLRRALGGPPATPAASVCYGSLYTGADASHV